MFLALYFFRFLDDLGSDMLSALIQNFCRCFYSDLIYQGYFLHAISFIISFHAKKPLLRILHDASRNTSFGGVPDFRSSGYPNKKIKRHFILYHKL